MWCVHAQPQSQGLRISMRCLVTNINKRGRPSQVWLATISRHVVAPVRQCMGVHCKLAHRENIAGFRVRPRRRPSTVIKHFAVHRVSHGVKAFLAHRARDS